MAVLTKNLAGSLKKKNLNVRFTKKKKKKIKKRRN